MVLDALSPSYAVPHIPTFNTVARPSSVAAPFVKPQSDFGASRSLCTFAALLPPNERQVGSRGRIPRPHQTVPVIRAKRGAIQIGGRNVALRRLRRLQFLICYSRRLTTPFGATRSRECAIPDLLLSEIVQIAD